MKSASFYSPLFALLCVVVVLADDHGQDDNKKTPSPPDTNQDGHDSLVQAGGSLFVYRAVPQMPNPNETYFVTTEPVWRHETCPDRFYNLLPAPPLGDEFGIYVETSSQHGHTIPHLSYAEIDDIDSNININTQHLGHYSIPGKPADSNSDWKPPSSSAPLQGLPFLDSANARIGLCTRWPVVVVRPLRCLAGEKDSYMAMLEISCKVDVVENKDQDKKE